MIELKEYNSFDAIHIYLKRVATEVTIPINLHIPNAKRIVARLEITNQKKYAKRYKSFFSFHGSKFYFVLEFTTYY
jgi:DNA-damage-inducible protein J